MSCTGSICRAAGTYNDGIKDRPLLALSYDSGVNWTFPESLTMPVFTPNDTYQFINGGYFLGASSDSSLLPDSLRILKNEFSPKPKSSN